MARYNCPEEGCNVYFDNSLDNIELMAKDHAFGSHGKIIDRDAVVEVIQGKIQPMPKVVVAEAVKKKKRKRRKKRKKRQSKAVEEFKEELKEVYEEKSSSKNKILDWWGKKS